MNLSHEKKKKLKWKIKDGDHPDSSSLLFARLILFADYPQKNDDTSVKRKNI